MAEGIPDALGDDQRAALVVSQLASPQQEAFQLELAKAAHGLKGDAPVPGRVKEDGSAQTYDERTAELEDAQANLVSSHGGESLEKIAAARAQGTIQA